VWAAPTRKRIHYVHNSVFFLVTRRLTQGLSYLLERAQNRIRTVAFLEQPLRERPQFSHAISGVQGGFKARVNRHRMTSHLLAKWIPFATGVAFGVRRFENDRASSAGQVHESVADISGIGTVRQIAGQVSLIDHPQRILSSAMERRRPSVRG
jgi:hypothetical protein